MIILVTGSRGFVGTETCKVLKEAGHEVVGFDIMDGFDIRDEAQLCETVVEEEIDRVLHLAAIARFSDADADPQLAFTTNVEGTHLITSVCKAYHLPLVYASTGSVYMPISEEPPITEEFSCRGNSVYGVSKYLGETYVREHTPHIILRYAHLYGREKRGHGLIGGFVSRIERGLEPTLYGGTQSNDFTYIKDVAQANLLALEAPWDKWNNVYNIGTGEELTAESAGETVCRVLGYTGKVSVKEGRPVDASRFVFDTSKASKLLGFTAAYSFESGLADMFKEE